MLGFVLLFVSVPWRGLRSFGHGGFWDEERGKIEFPSPGGDYGLSDRHRARPGVRRVLVSVPWRGLRSFGLGVDQDLPGAHGWVSVPWRGLRSFGLLRLVLGNYERLKFPSPGGDYGLSDVGVFRCVVTGGERFRPLAGITVFRTESMWSSTSSRNIRFRPLAGITVFRTGAQMKARILFVLVSVPWRGLRSFGPGYSAI